MHWKKEVCMCTCKSVFERETEITHLYSHRDVLLADIVVMLVSVQHYDSIGQGKACIVAHESRAVHFLQVQTNSRHNVIRNKQYII